MILSWVDQIAVLRINKTKKYSSVELHFLKINSCLFVPNLWLYGRKQGSEKKSRVVISPRSRKWFRNHDEFQSISTIRGICLKAIGNHAIASLLDFSRINTIDEKEWTLRCWNLSTFEVFCVMSSSMNFLSNACAYGIRMLSRFNESII